ncbi:ABC transporter permease [Piscinibacter sp.]|uniref:ABC transporter permease n=1 Tax=Piscinibacter sp. TaxID=1903157 RepID=UPI002B8C7275|nr:ABC transporter permease [Albitalea sp.]HUG25543.1 ABC transporter permease [Albitalea sp.]
MKGASAAVTAWVVFRKEIVDALRDRRTLAVVLVSSVLLGPLVMIALSAYIATFEARAEQRDVYVSGIEHAPSLKNYFERQTYTVHEAPADFEARLRLSKFSDPVVVVPTDFETAVLSGDAPVVEVVSDSANRQAESGTGRIHQLLAGYLRERATLDLAMRGVSPELLRPMEVEERDLASTQTRAAQVTGMLPFFVMMAVLYGALTAALDTTAGERERGSLEPLLMNPAERFALVLGKWGAVASLGMLIAVLSCLSFLPAQWLLRSDNLQALFQFGWREAALFLAVLLPFAAALSAVLMAVAIRCKSFKEAQANSTVVVLGVSLLPLVTVFNQSGESPWHLWVPGLAQSVLMARVLKGEGFGAEQVAVPLVACLLLTAVGVWLVARMLKTAAVR